MDRALRAFVMEHDETRETLDALRLVLIRDHVPETVRLVMRDRLIRQAAGPMGKDDLWPRAKALAKRAGEIEAHWPRWQGSQEPPLPTDGVTRTLFAARRISGEPLPEQRQIHRILLRDIEAV